jgi:hypothetical protein
MEKNIVWEANGHTKQTWPQEVKIIRQTLLRSLNSAILPMEWLRKYYSSIFEKELSLRQTLLLVNAQVAFFCAAFPVEGPLWIRLSCCAWLLHALRSLKGI